MWTVNNNNNLPSILPRVGIRLYYIAVSFNGTRLVGENEPYSALIRPRIRSTAISVAVCILFSFRCTSISDRTDTCTCITRARVCRYYTTLS